MSMTELKGQESTLSWTRGFGFSVVPVYHSTTSQSWVCASSRMCKRADSAPRASCCPVVQLRRTNGLISTSLWIISAILSLQNRVCWASEEIGVWESRVGQETRYGHTACESICFQQQPFPQCHPSQLSHPGPHFVEYLSFEVTQECDVYLKCKVRLLKI